MTDEKDREMPLSGQPPEELSLEEIMKEYRTEQVLTPRRPRPDPVLPEPPEETPPRAELPPEPEEPDAPKVPEPETGEPAPEVTEEPEQPEEEPAAEDAAADREPSRGKVIQMPGRPAARDEEGTEEEESGEDRGLGRKLARRLEQLRIRLRTHRPKVLERPPEEPDALESARRQREIYRRSGAAARKVLITLLPLLYLTFAHRTGLPLPGFLSYLESPYAWLFTVICLQCLAMVFGADVLLTGARDLGRLSPSCESLVTVTCGASLLHALSVMIFPAWGGFLPYCAVSVLALFLNLWARSASARGRFISLRIAAMQENPYTVTCQERLYDKHDGFVKRRDSGTEGFVSGVLQPDLAHRIMRLAAPLLLITVLALSVIASFGKGHPETFLWSLSALSAAAAAGSPALAFALPFLRMCRRLKTFGAAVGGSGAMGELSHSAALLLQDDDVFPPGSVTLNGMKLFHGYDVERVVAYAYNLAMYSGNCLGRLFEGVVKGSRIPDLPVEEISYYEAGGVSGLVEGNRVLVGTREFMQRSGVHLPANIAVEHAVLVAFNYELAGIFAMNYAPAGSVARILPQLTDGRNFLVLATRDFNITPELLRKKYRLDLRHLEVPGLEQRVELSDEDVLMEGKPLAVIIREGLSPYAESVLTSRRAYRVGRINLVLSLLATVVALLLMGFMAAAGAFASASPCNLFIYLALWAVPYVLTAGYVGR